MVKINVNNNNCIPEKRFDKIEPAMLQAILNHCREMTLNDIIITPSMKCGEKLLIHSQTSTVQPHTRPQF